MDEFEKLSHDIIGAAFNVRKNVGRGMLEKYYEGALAYELRKLDHTVDCQVSIPALYCGQEIGEAYRADLVVDNKVIIELKAIAVMNESQSCQLFTYLKLSNYKLGFLINFGAKDFKIGNFYESGPYQYGIYRMVNQF